MKVSSTSADLFDDSTFVFSVSIVLALFCGFVQQHLSISFLITHLATIAMSQYNVIMFYKVDSYVIQHYAFSQGSTQLLRILRVVL